MFMQSGRRIDERWLALEEVAQQTALSEPRGDRHDGRHRHNRPPNCPHPV